MPRASFFAQVGLFVARDFLDTELCARVRREMRASQTRPATVLDDQNQDTIKDEVRRTTLALVSPETEAAIVTNLMAVKPSLETHFGVALSDLQALSFLIYDEGYYFTAHRDISYDPEKPSWLRERRVSISVFLNGECEADVPDTYSGGALTFYGLFSRKSEDPLPFPLTGEEGLLIGFRPELMHSVQPVNRGARYSIVTWFT